MIDFILAIDPGASGGMAVGMGKRGVIALSMPSTPADIVELLNELWELKEPGERGVCYLEKVNGYGGLPGVRMFNFGENYGVIQGALASMKAPTVLVTPQAWMKRLGLGGQGAKNKSKWKNTLKAEAQRRYPELKITLKTADALLILAAHENDE
jgi:hypothetical protein